MDINEKVRYIAKDLIVAYVAYAQDNLKTQPLSTVAKRMIDVGIDDNLDAYKGLLLTSLAEALCVTPPVNTFDRKLVRQTKSKMTKVIKAHEANAFIKRHKNLIFESCSYLFLMVEKGVRNGNL